jgi:hypothetical protein
VLLRDADTREQVTDLSHAIHGQPGGLDLLQIGAPGRREREVAPALPPMEAAGRPLERPRDHAPHTVFTAHDAPRRLARRIEIRLGQNVDVRRELQHRVGRRVEDHLARVQVMTAEVLDHLSAAVWAVAAKPETGRALEGRNNIRGEAVRIGRKRMLRHDAHHLPVPCGRFLARSHWMEPAVDDRVRHREHSFNARDVAQAKGAENRQIEAADGLRHVRERVRVHGIAVLRRVRQRPHSTGVHHYHCRTCHCVAIMSMPASAILKG